MKKKSMKPDNNNLDAIAKQARTPLPKAGFGMNFIGSKLVDKGVNNMMGSMATGAGIDKSAKTQKLEEKATSGLGILKPFAGMRYKANLAKDAISSKVSNMGNTMGQMATNPVGYGLQNASDKTGIPKDQIAQMGIKAGMAAAGVPPIGLKKGGSVKKKKK
jgi:hypothetical protein